MDVPVDLMKNFNDCVPVRKYFSQAAIDTVAVQSLLGFLYTIIWLMAVSSNLLVLVVIFVMKCSRSRDVHGRARSRYRPRLPSAVNTSSFSVRIVFVVSLACSDLLTSLTSLPVTAVNILTHVWPFPTYMCHCIGFFQAFSIFQSSFTFTSIAVDRYLLVFYPDHAVVTYGTARCGVAFMAIIAATLATPMFIFVEVKPIEPVCGQFCVENWPENSTFFSQRVYGLFVIILQFGTPALVTAICYLMIASRLRSRAKSSAPHGQEAPVMDTEKFVSVAIWKYIRHRLSSAQQETSHRLIPTAERRSNERRRRANRMMAAMVAAFTILWLPFNTFNILRDFDLFDRVFPKQAFSVLYAFAHLIAMTTLVWNPIIYAWFNKSIRSAVRSVFRCGPS